MSIVLTSLTPEEIVEQSLGQPAPGRRPRQFDLAQSDRSAVGADAEPKLATSSRRSGEEARFAISPIVLARGGDSP
ncbi:MAG: hypothetical protein R2856_04430 [Caldilineaceae bacterium]